MGQLLTDPPNPLLAVPNVTAHPSMASVPITVLLYNGPLRYAVLMCSLKGQMTHYHVFVMVDSI